MQLAVFRDIMMKRIALSQCSYMLCVILYCDLLPSFMIHKMTSLTALH